MENAGRGEKEEAAEYKGLLGPRIRRLTREGPEGARR